jgi:hypothetical protein
MSREAYFGRRERFLLDQCRSVPYTCVSEFFYQLREESLFLLGECLMYRSRFLLGLFVAAFVAVGLSSGDDKKDPKPAKGALPAHFKQLGLSDDQTTKIKQIHGEYKDKIDDLEVQVKKLKDQEKAEYLKVLTDDQKKKLAQLVIGDDAEKKKEEK